jgi:hypothetical protein
MSETTFKPMTGDGVEIVVGMRVAFEDIEGFDPSQITTSIVTAIYQTPPEKPERFIIECEGGEMMESQLCFSTRAAAIAAAPIPQAEERK